MRIIGIDPGKTGGIACIDTNLPNQSTRVTATKMPLSELEIAAHLRLLALVDDDVYAFIELVHAMPAMNQVRDPDIITRLCQRITGSYDRRIAEILQSEQVDMKTRVLQGSVGTFTFGQGYGFLRGCLRALGIKFEAIRPQDWQGIIGCRTKGNKNVSKQKAEQLFGGRVVRVTHAIADALLIAEAGRRIPVASRKPEP